MRCVTKKPPAMLMVAISTAITERMVTGDWMGPEICSMPPTKMMPLTALVTLINGVCSAGVTFHTTCQPTKQASTNTVKCETNSLGATEPSKPSDTSATTANATLRNG